VVHSLSRPF